MKRILLLGSGELGKEFVIAAQRVGQYVIACDSYAGAPAMQVADESEVFSMLDGDALERVVRKHRPDIIVPEIEAIRTERLYDFEQEGIQVVPSARAVNFTMNRKAIRDLAAKELGLKTARYYYAKSLDELKEAAAKIGFPCVVKPLMSSSGKGQSVVKGPEELEHAWEYGCSGSRIRSGGGSHQKAFPGVWKRPGHRTQNSRQILPVPPPKAAASALPWAQRPPPRPFSDSSRPWKYTGSIQFPLPSPGERTCRYWPPGSAIRSSLYSGRSPPWYPPAFHPDASAGPLKEGRCSGRR